MKLRSATGLMTALALMAMLLFCCDLLVGSADISIADLFNFFTGNMHNEEQVTILHLFRLPKAYTAILAGISLPVAGLLMQTFFRNPIAGPDILGVTAGSSVFVALVMMTGGAVFGFSSFHGLSIVFAAILGAVAMLLVILLVASRLRDSMTLLIFGLMLGMALSAVVSVLQYYSERGALKMFMLWTFGSLGGVTYEQLYIMAPVILAGVIGAWVFAGRLNVLLLGESYATSLGVHIKTIRMWMIIITAILTGTITAFCGPIAFIGIAVPHLARMLFRQNNHYVLIPGSMLLGMIIMLICDMLTQISGDAGVLPLNAVTAFMGAPFVIYIIWRSQHLRRTF